MFTLETRKRLWETNDIDDIEKIVISLKLTTVIFTPENSMALEKIIFGAHFAYSFWVMFAISFRKDLGIVFTLDSASYKVVKFWHWKNFPNRSFQRTLGKGVCASFG